MKRYWFLMVLLMLCATIALADTPATDTADEPLGDDGRAVKLLFDQPPDPLSQQNFWEIFVPDAIGVIYKVNSGDTIEAISWLLYDDALGRLDGNDRRDLWLDLLDPIPQAKPGAGISVQLFPNSPFAAGIYTHEGELFAGIAGHTSW